MPFGWGANPNRRGVLRIPNQRGSKSPMPFGWGANPNTAPHSGLPALLCFGHQCLSAGGLIQTVHRPGRARVARVPSPMPFGWGANPNSIQYAAPQRDAVGHQCLSAGGLIQTCFVSLRVAIRAGVSPMPFGWGANPNPPPHDGGVGGVARRHQCLSAGGLIQTPRRRGKPPRRRGSHQCLSAGGLIQTS